MEQFILPTLGGLLIGIASVLLLATLGRVAGISGIVWGAIAAPDRRWRWLFLIGLVAGTALMHITTGIAIPAEHTDAPLLLITLAGVLVGLGTRIGNGCTSGHGICGLGRLSVRSLVATSVFMATGVITVAVVRHLFGSIL